MGGDNSPQDIPLLAAFCKKNYPDLKVGWYSGRNKLPENFDLSNLDYYKLGPYKAECGPLNKRTTNQRYYAKWNDIWCLATDLF